MPVHFPLRTLNWHITLFSKPFGFPCRSAYYLYKWLAINNLTFLINDLIAPRCNGFQNRDESFAKIG